MSEKGHAVGSEVSSEEQSAIGFDDFSKFQGLKLFHLGSSICLASEEGIHL